MDRFSALIPHLCRTADVEQRLHHSDMCLQGCLQLLNRLHRPVALLISEARIVVGSAAFEQAIISCGLYASGTTDLQGRFNFTTAETRLASALGLPGVVRRKVTA
jgi:hypothetical protein